MKKDSYRQELDQLMEYKQRMLHPTLSMQRELERMKDVANIQQYAQRELGNQAAYRNKFT